MHTCILKINCACCLFPTFLLGTFFGRYNPYCEYGAFPLFFAVSVGSIEIVKILIEAKANPFQRDQMKNTILHMAVLHDQPEMYRFCHAFLEDRLFHGLKTDEMAWKGEAVEWTKYAGPSFMRSKDKHIGNPCKSTPSAEGAQARGIQQQQRNKDAKLGDTPLACVYYNG